MTVDWFGDRAVLVTLDDPATRDAWRDALSAAFPHCVVRGGMSSVLVEAASPRADLLDRVRDHCAALVAPLPAAGADAPGSQALVRIAVSYDGEDLDLVARTLDCSAQALVDAHQQQRWAVAMMGFAPGFGYLVPDGAPLLDWSACARRDQPRARVPAGSVALAAGMSAVYPEELPGGWHLLGRTRQRLFDASAVDPSVLHPGDRVRFTAEPA